MTVSLTPPIATNAPIPTWFGIGGRADRLAKPTSIEELRGCLSLDPDLLILGDGANLLVADEGVGQLVASLDGDFRQVSVDAKTHIARVGAAAGLFRIIPEFVRQGFAGLESLAGIPASLGGAIRMNAGGKFGSIAESVLRVHVMDRSGRSRWLERSAIAFNYRASGLDDLLVLEADLQLTPTDPAAVRDRFKEFMAYKKSTQPMGEPSAGCVFKNPTLRRDLADIGQAGARVSAGMLADRAGCKGLEVGGASVSRSHANFIVTRKGAAANDVITLMDRVRARVHDAFGVELEPEVVIWRRHA